MMNVRGLYVCSRPAEEQRALRDAKILPKDLGGPQGKGSVLAAKAVETQGRGGVLATRAVETQGIGSVVAMKVVETLGKGSVLRWSAG